MTPWTPENYDALYAWMLAQGGLADLSDHAVADAYNAADQPTKRPVDPAAVKQLALRQGKWLSLVKAAKLDTETGAAAALAMEFINDARYTELDLENGDVKTMFRALVSGEVIDETFAAEIEGMADAWISQRQVDGAPRPANHGDVHWVRTRMMTEEADG